MFLLESAERGAENSWKPGGVMPRSWVGVVELGLCQVSEIAKMSGLFVLIMSVM